MGAARLTPPVVHSDGRGRYEVTHLVSDVVWFHFEGWVTGDLWRPSEELLESVIADQGHVLMLGNGAKWSGYEPAYREGCTRWFLRRRRVVRGVHLLVRSRLLRMGVQVVNLAIPIIEAYDDAAAFMKQAEGRVRNIDALLRTFGIERPAAG
jgi:hypothetical protein